MKNIFIIQFYSKEFGIKSQGVTEQSLNLIKDGLSKLKGIPIILGCTELSLCKTELEKEFKLIDPIDCLVDDVLFELKENQNSCKHYSLGMVGSA
tara:strand:+ start:241 stop:525 length:285 start_codon:yes stop_codon:yes gene_type:complete